MNSHQENTTCVNVKIDTIKTDLNYSGRSDIDNESDDFRNFVSTIRESGMIQPIIIRENESNEIELVAGKKRLLAAQSLGWETITAIYTDKSPQVISLIENIQRQSLTVIERAEAINQLLIRIREEEPDMVAPQQEIARRIGLEPSSITDYKKIAEMPDELKDRVRANPFCGINKLVKIARIADRDEQERELNEYIEDIERRKSNQNNQNEENNVGQANEQNSSGDSPNSQSEGNQIGNNQNGNGQGDSEPYPIRVTKNKINKFKESFEKQAKNKEKWKPEEKEIIKNELSDLKTYIEHTISEITGMEGHRQEPPGGSGDEDNAVPVIH